MAKNELFNGFLSDEGRLIFDELLSHCKTKLNLENVDEYELSMLANSFALYASCARICNETGVSMEFEKEGGGIYQQIRPEYTVMKNEYQNILKHSGKFGLNPGDRSKIFKKLDQGKKKKAFDDKLKVAS